MRTVGISLLGCGNIGCGVLRLLREQEETIAAREGVRISIRKVLVRDLKKPRRAEIPREALTVSAEEILQDPGTEIILEFMGGCEPAASYMAAALRAGKTVVTANKMALAGRWQALAAAAREGGAGLFFEAAVGGAIPIVRALTDSLQANRIRSVVGIINGTTNYILTRMAEEGMPYAEALAEAQRLGLAEPDPASDVEGYDCACKLSILAALAFRRFVPPEAVYREGITRITPIDLRCGREMGLALKLLAVGRETDAGLEMRVHPAFVPEKHPLASVSGAFNAVFVEGHACGEMMFYGRGAGDMPTAGAVVSDLIHACRGSRPALPACEDARPLDDWPCAYFIRMRAEDQPGVLSMVSGRFAEEGVSIASMVQKGARDGEGCVQLVLLTHGASEGAVRRAIAKLDAALVHQTVFIRVEGQEVL